MPGLCFTTNNFFNTHTQTHTHLIFPILSTHVTKETAIHERAAPIKSIDDGVAVLLQTGSENDDFIPQRYLQSRKS